MRVLFLNHPFVECGVYQFGERVYDLMSKSRKYNSFYRRVHSRDEYLHYLDWVKPNRIIYNYHWDRMPWLTEQDVNQNKASQHYFIYHDGSMFKYYDKYLFFGDFDPERKAVPEGKRVLLPRPLIKYTGDYPKYTGNYPKNKIVTIGSFGFCSKNKRFPGLVELVNKEFSKAKINFHITRPYFGDNHGFHLENIINECKKRNKNPNIKLSISTDFINNEDILSFLAGNDINVFYYSGDNNPGLSAALDYALSVKRPIAVTSAPLLRSIANDDILIEKNSLRDILKRGTKPLQQYYDKWSTEMFTKKMEELLLN